MARSGKTSNTHFYLLYHQRKRKYFSMEALKLKLNPCNLGSAQVGTIQVLATMRGLQHYQQFLLASTQTSFVLHWEPQMQAAIIATKGKTHQKPSQARQNNSPKLIQQRDTQLCHLHSLRNQEENPALGTQQSRGWGGGERILKRHLVPIRSCLMEHPVH